MTTFLTVLCLLASAPEPTPAEGPAVPEWSKTELHQFFDSAQAARSIAKNEAEYFELLARVAGAAYRVKREPGESAEAYARKIVRGRKKCYPELARGSWIRAAMTLFYADTSRRANLLSKFETDRHERVYLDNNAQGARAGADEWGRSIFVSVEGIDGPLEPLPIGEGPKMDDLGFLIQVRGSDVLMGGMKRGTLPGGVAPETMKRTAKGALKEFSSAMKQHNIHGEMMSRLEKKYWDGKSVVRFYGSAHMRMSFLNEIVRSGREAGIETLNIAVYSCEGGIGKISVPIVPPKPAKSKSKPVAPTPVRCKDEIELQACVGWIVEQSKAGPVVFETGD